MRGLILEGGAMRGMFTCGALDVFMEQGIVFDGMIGVSAGAVFGCNYKSRQPGRALRYNKRYCADKRYCSFDSLLRTGDLYNAEFCYHTLPTELDVFDTAAFQENPMAFYVTCTDVTTGKPVYHRCDNGDGEDILWMRASASMPLVSQVVEIGAEKLLDGGIADSVPLDYMESLGYRGNVVILTQPLDYVKKPNNLVPLARMLLRKYPKMVEAMADRHLRYNQTTAAIRAKEQKGEVFVLRPPEALRIGSMEKKPEELERVYQIGRKTALDRLPALKTYLKEAVK